MWFIYSINAGFAGNAPEASKLKSRGGAKKTPAKKVSLGYSNILPVKENEIPLFDWMLSLKVMVAESDEDEEVLALKNQLAAYNLDSSPDQSGMLSFLLITLILCNLSFLLQNPGILGDGLVSLQPWKLKNY